MVQQILDDNERSTSTLMRDPQATSQLQATSRMEHLAGVKR
jgi:hypothetical protein